MRMQEAEEEIGDSSVRAIRKGTPLITEAEIEEMLLRILR